MPSALADLGLEGKDAALDIRDLRSLLECLRFVRPQMKPGWEISITQRKLDEPIEGPHGTVTEVVDEVAWRGGPLPDAYFDEFGLSMRLPVEQGTLYFPTVQACEEGVHRWIEIPSSGQEWDDLEEPAPFVTVEPAE